MQGGSRATSFAPSRPCAVRPALNRPRSCCGHGCEAVGRAWRTWFARAEARHSEAAPSWCPIRLAVMGTPIPLCLCSPPVGAMMRRESAGTPCGTCPTSGDVARARGLGCVWCARRATPGHPWVARGGKPSPHGLVPNVHKGNVPSPSQSLATYGAQDVVSPPISVQRIDHADGERVP